MSSPTLPIAITLGDPAGVGPEIVLRLFAEAGFAEGVCPFVVGCAGHLQSVKEYLVQNNAFGGIDALQIVATDAPPRVFEPGIVPVIQPDGPCVEVHPGVITAECGAVAWASIRCAVELVREGKAAGVVTAPIHKEALKAAGCKFPGHTEMLADLAGGVEMAMLLAGGGLRVALATIHEPITKVPALLNEDKIFRLIMMLNTFLPWFGIDRERPRIGVTGLNPHAGEGGMFGEEEMQIISPAIERAAERGVEVVGPLPADTAFHFHREGAYDGMLAMYHDQALIPVKTLDFHGGVNITMGLPFIRTSVDHGTAFDIAWQGKARPDSLRAALGTAVTLVLNRFGRAESWWENK